MNKLPEIKRFLDFKGKLNMYNYNNEKKSFNRLTKKHQHAYKHVGYAPGNYLNSCRKCKKEIIIVKRGTICFECADIIVKTYFMKNKNIM